MNIKILGIALILVTVTYGCTNTVQVVQTEPESETVQVAEAAPDTETVEGDEVAQGTELDPDDPDAITCKMIAKTGSRVKTKICGTNRQWALNEEASQENTKKMQNRVQYRSDEG